MLVTHYREPIDFSVKRLEEAENLIAKLGRRVEEADKGDSQTILSALADELNTVEAIAQLNHLAGAPLRDALEMLGIAFSKVELDLSESEIEAKIAERLALFAEKNFDEADRIRAELLDQGIQLKDSKDSETGERVTSWEVKR